MGFLPVYWREVKDGNPAGQALFLRHYSCRNHAPETRNFVGVGEKIALMTWDDRAVFSWLRNRVERWDGQVGVYCTLFRNESDILSSLLITEAMAWAWVKWPGERPFTYVAPKKIESPNPGYCFKMAGWRKCGKSKSGLVALEYLPEWRPAK